MKKQLGMTAIACILSLAFTSISGQVSSTKSLMQLQQEFLNLKTGMFIEFNLPTYSQQHWIDPETPVSVFNPTKLDCRQWANAAKSAGMGYAILTAKHHNGFCIWDTKTTEYNVMKSPLKRDVVKEFADVFHKKGIKVFLYYSILDMKNDIRSGWIDRDKINFIKSQIDELLSNYGEISGIYLDGWNAYWSRISYDEVPFEELYTFIKSKQPNCLVITNNGGKYPEDKLFYSDILTYNNPTARLKSKTNSVPAHNIISLNRDWFWKPGFDKLPVMKAQEIETKYILPLNGVNCNATLNVTPNRDGLIDQNLLSELKELGKLNTVGVKQNNITSFDLPVISTNLALNQKTNSSWSQDWLLSDLATDNNYQTMWKPNFATKKAYLEVVFEKPTEINCIGFCEGENIFVVRNPFKSSVESYELKYWDNNEWRNIEIKDSNDKIRLHDCNKIITTKIRIQINAFKPGFGISEVLIFNKNKM